MNSFIFFAAAVLMILLLKGKLSKVNHPNVKNITAEEGKELIENNKNVLVLDVRTKDEFARGHIKNAKLIPVSELDQRLSSIKSYKDKPVLVHCASGGRSPRAVKLLLKNEFTQIYHLYRGLNSWKYNLIKK
ncbi:rhodanese-like domain-containing protein [Clostridium polynesiense]|uniref:rhodanese-like domain-containing protein n=1 Tax=Clostridium polynesiense TaxID=1325933 RepID=UPI00058D9CC1|nr:rhodanese-like domain-containing protein [Clostridium polynesiense]